MSNASEQGGWHGCTLCDRKLVFTLAAHEKQTASGYRGQSVGRSPLYFWGLQLIQMLALLNVEGLDPVNLSPCYQRAGAKCSLIKVLKSHYCPLITPSLSTRRHNEIKTNTTFPAFEQHHSIQSPSCVPHSKVSQPLRAVMLLDILS